MKKSSPKRNNSVRIIGGEWKSRRVRCADVVGLRPSPDAVRETLFNWLPRSLEDKCCLDLFAGSGAFGFEAASRGAAVVCMVESHARAVEMLRANRDALQADEVVEIFPNTVEKFLRSRSRENSQQKLQQDQRQDQKQNPQQNQRKFDIIFIDPPFDADLIATTCEMVQAQGVCNPRALVYIESRYADCPLPIPASWRIIREKRCGMVQSTLIQSDG